VFKRDGPTTRSLFVKKNYSKEISLAGLAVILTIGFVHLLLSPWQVRPKILDPRFRILMAKVTYGTNQTLFREYKNQTWGRVSYRIRQQLVFSPPLNKATTGLGLHVTSSQPVRASRTNSTYFFLFRYTGQFTDAELSGVNAELYVSDSLGVVLRSLPKFVR
jgi:hypothetical protein